MSDTEHLIAEQIPKLRRYARALLGDPIRADDLVQEALVRGLSRSHLWQPGTDIRAWMFTILHNIHINNQRHAPTLDVDVASAFLILDGTECQLSGFLPLDQKHQLL